MPKRSPHWLMVPSRTLLWSPDVLKREVEYLGVPDNNNLAQLFAIKTSTVTQFMNGSERRGPQCNMFLKDLEDPALFYFQVYLNGCHNETNRV